MRHSIADQDRIEDVKRKKLLLGIAAAVVLLTIFVSFGLSQMAVHNVDTKKGIQKIQELEKMDITSIQTEIDALEEAERKADEEWKNRPLSEKFESAVVLGDSITTGFIEYEVLDSSKVVAQKGVHLNQLDEMIETTVKLKPKTLFLALGLNDVTLTDGDTEEFIESYEGVIDTLREKLPNTKIYINCILPVQEKAIESTASYEHIAEYNEALMSFCEENDIKFIDNTEIVKDEYYESDGEHMKPEYYPLWGEHMAEVAGI